ncbi:hypothetical protein GCM10010532_025000 [Dactylosporangium siamense]|uniref:Uncharacterized protein n=1 Tax=Dactylosporangium siamense TaxID=685454 RepID=A0A919PZG5_9ACTN|nr:hypothetical protein Dsi01nite_091660 [Dactylosporangium siamense]
MNPILREIECIGVRFQNQKLNLRVAMPSGHRAKCWPEIRGEYSIKLAEQSAAQAPSEHLVRQPGIKIEDGCTMRPDS